MVKIIKKSVNAENRKVESKNTLKGILTSKNREKLVRHEGFRYYSHAKSALSFQITVLGNTYPFTFTRDQLNEAYGNAMSSVMAGSSQETVSVKVE